MSHKSPLQGILLLVTEFDLISTTTAGGVLYGIGFALYYLYVQSLLPQLQDPDKKRQLKFMLAYTSVIMLCGLVYLGIGIWQDQDAYIRHRNFPGGPFLYEQGPLHTQPLIAVGFVAEDIIHILTSAMQVS